MKSFLIAAFVVLCASPVLAQGYGYGSYGQPVYGTSRMNALGNRMTYNFSNGMYGTARMNALGNRINYNFSNGVTGTARISPFGNRVNYQFSPSPFTPLIPPPFFTNPYSDPYYGQ